MIKNRIFIFILSLLLLCTSCNVCFATETSQNNLAVTSGCHSVNAAISFLGQEQIVKNAQSVFLFETGSKTLMYAWNADEAMHPASLVKIMTALLVLEQGNLSDEVVVMQSALDTVSSDAISVDLQEGEQLTVEELMYCMVVYSANDAAAVLAEYIADSQGEFVAMMNNRAAELGCTGTNYTNPHGLHNDEQFTTARDTCRILQAALKYEIFRTMFGTVHYTVPATNKHEERNLSTNNYLMNRGSDVNSFSIHYDSRVTGGRAGVTADGYRCIASTSQSGNMELICVVMGAKSVYSDDGYSVSSYGGFPETSQLLDAAYSGFSRQQIIYENQVLRQQPVLNGDSDVFAGSYEGFSTVLPVDISFDQLSFRYADAPGSTQAPIQKGQNLAALQVWYGSMCIAQTDVYALNDVPVAFSKQPLSDIKDTNGNGWLWVLITFIIVLGLAVSVILWLHHSNKIRYQKRKKRRIRRGNHNDSVG